ncbi:MAG: hypothetical protein ACPGR8_15025 [Limisphaerales bacterium]
MPIFVWSDFVARRKWGKFLYADAGEVMDDLRDEPAEAAVLRAVLSQICIYSGKTVKKKTFLSVALPQFVIDTDGLACEKAGLAYALNTFELKKRHFRAKELNGDHNLVLCVTRRGIFFLFFSDIYHYVRIHHYNDILYSFDFEFLAANPNTTEYAADAAVKTRKILEKYLEFRVI